MKIVFISSLLPSGHYSQYLINGLGNIPELNLIVYADKDPGNIKIKGGGKIKAIWSKSIKYIFEISQELKEDKPDIVHLQHEINMFGGIFTAIFFPLLLLLIKLKGSKRIVTVHCAIPQALIDKKFMVLFHKNPFLMKPVFIKIFFSYLYKTIAYFSDLIIVHTQKTKDVLLKDYGVSFKKISVIPPSIPERKILTFDKQKYFLYFGYMVRRKGLFCVLDGFKKFLEKNSNSSFKLVMAGDVIKGQELAQKEIMDFISNDEWLRKNVVFKGFVEEEELDELYGHANAVVVPAEISMGASGPLYHAFSYGKCALASKVGHLIEEIDHLKNGYLVNNDRWQEAFQFCLDRAPEVCLIEKAAIELAKLRTPFQIARKHLEVYNKTLSTC